MVNESLNEVEPAPARKEPPEKGGPAQGSIPPGGRPQQEDADGGNDPGRRMEETVGELVQFDSRLSRTARGMTACDATGGSGGARCRRNKTLGSTALALPAAGSLGMYLAMRLIGCDQLARG